MRRKAIVGGSGGGGGGGNGSSFDTHWVARRRHMVRHPLIPYPLITHPLFEVTACSILINLPPPPFCCH